MTRRKRLVWRIAAGLAALLLMAVVAGFFIVRSAWFYEKVRTRIVTTVETATGGRAEIGTFRFDWSRMRAEVTGFVIHGTEPAGKPPLFRAKSAAVGLKIISILKRDVDIAYLDVVQPQVYLMVGPDGRTNVPEPKVHTKPGAPPVQTILKLAIGRFALQQGEFEVESRGKTPFNIRGQNLNTNLLYDLTGPRYRGEISIQPLDVAWSDFKPLPAGLTVALTVEQNRIAITSGRLTTGASRIGFSGTIENLASPYGAFDYDATIAVPEATKVLHIEELHHGTVQLTGQATWSGSSAFAATGRLKGWEVAFRDSTIRLADFRLDGAVTLGPKGVDVTGLQLAGNYLTDGGKAAVGGRVANATVRGKDINLRGVALAVFGGTFQGDGSILDLRRYNVTGEITGIEVRPMVAMYSPYRLPWNARTSGPVHVEGEFRRKEQLLASATFAVAPGPESAPVHGQIAIVYQARDRIVQVGHSAVTLPSSHLEFSGALGRRMMVHLDTRDLDDLLPAIGETADMLPARLTGTAVFDGSVTGDLEEPQIAGHVRVTGIEYGGETYDSLEADAEVSPQNIRLRRAVAARGALRAQFDMALGLERWKIVDASPFSGSATVRGAPVPELIALAGKKDLPVTGTLTASAQASGTVGEPHFAADLDVTRGSVRDEPFDRFTAHLDYTNSVIELTQGQLNAGEGRATLSATYRHPPGRFDSGRLHAEVNTNGRPLDQVRSIQSEFPGVKGTVQVAAAGDFDITPAAGGGASFRLTALNADVTAHALQLDTQSLGDAHLLVTTQAGVLRGHLESNLANSEVRGDGQWRLEGDYPGTATITFAKVDLAQLKTWLAPPSDGSPSPLVGSAEGELRVDGPLLQKKLLKATLRIPKFEIGPAPQGSVPAGQLLLHNSGPISVSLANDVITVDSARLTGPASDFSITGKVTLQPKSALDLRVNGHMDLGLVHDFNNDFTSSGTVVADATVRGSLSNPLVNGRMQFQKAAFSLESLPNGLSNANGVIVFTSDQNTGTRATIQSFSADTGGGKLDLFGFAGYSDGQDIFRIHARAREVRIRYPEGVSTIANASLNLTGSTEHSMLEGTVTIVRTGFNPDADSSSLLAKSAEPVQTPSARTGLVGGLNFDVQITTAPDVQFQSSLTQDIQMEANLRLRGTFSNPAVLGRINITQGQLTFFGTKYTINQGTVSFFNPVRLEPILDVDLETKANGIDVTLNVSGPFNKPKLTPRSDPPLQFNEIVALLATGRSPTSDPTRLAQESTAPQSWQQMGASALLGQAIASPVAGRLQRFFGVSRLRIDPTISGVENNPQARLSLEQQVTQDITFTYITNVTSSNPQVVRVEWAFAKKWSVVALREENGLFGLDFFFKKRF